MDFEEMLKKFEFLFEESNDVKRDIILAKENVDIQVEKEKYAEIALRYIRENSKIKNPESFQDLRRGAKGFRVLRCQAYQYPVDQF